MDCEWIEKAFEFYNINKEYIDKCYKCMQKIVNNKEYLDKFQKVRHILYEANFQRIKDLWSIKDKDELFWKNVDSFITNLMILSGYEYHKVNINNHKLNKEQIIIHKRIVKECFENDLIYRKYNGVRISQMLWATYFIRVRIIEIGRLQYEYENTENNISIIKIHIPKGQKLDFTEVKKSIEKSKSELEQIFKLNEMKYICNSWLLSNQIYNMLDKSSNISLFHNLFVVEDGENCIDDILNFVYEINECDDYNQLSEKTSLQKKIKERLLKDKKIYLGLGILK